VYFVTARTFQARMLLRPSREINEVVGGVLAKAVARYDVSLYGYVFASNHVHLLVGVSNATLSAFMQYLLGNLARKIGRLVGWTGALWERRFSAETVLDDGAMVGRLKYILAHGVKEGLVRKVADWPGLSCLEQLLGTPRRAFRWFHWKMRWEKGKLVEGGESLLSEKWAEEVHLELATFPLWRRCSPARRAELVRAMVGDIEAEGTQRGGAIMGSRAIQAQHPHRRPKGAKRSPRPLCHATLRVTRMAFLDAYRSFVAAYRSASARFRKGDRAAVFPRLAFPPSGFHFTPVAKSLSHSFGGFGGAGCGSPARPYQAGGGGALA
jgi:REP element-mobilizing transposase RayT